MLGSWARTIVRALDAGKHVLSEKPPGRTLEDVAEIIEAEKRTASLFTNWVDPRYNAGTFGANLLRDIIGEQNPFPYPKSIHTVGDAIFSADLAKDAVVLDFFGGSGLPVVRAGEVEMVEAVAAAVAAGEESRIGWILLQLLA